MIVHEASKRDFIKHVTNDEILDECGKIRYSKSLQDALKVMIDGNEEFVMIDGQKVAFESISQNHR